MIVVDASAALSALLNDGRARQAMAGEELLAPHLIDAEVANGLRRLVAAGQLAPVAGWHALDVFRRLGLSRFPLANMLDRVWALRENLTAYDASYVALAEHLDCSLVTADSRLSRAHGVRCTITVVPR